MTTTISRVRQGAGPRSGTGLTKFLDPLRIPQVISVDPDDDKPRLRMPLRSAELPLHSELPPTPLWTYKGEFPGPTIEVRRGQRLRVTWANRIRTPFPVVSVDVEFDLDPEQSPPQPGNTPGRDGAEPRADVAQLPPWAVTHLHGARISGASDGLPENAVLPGDAQLAEYPNRQQATALWYHDHAMHITAFNVMSGLVGMYLIRDDEEDALRLPRGEYEIPLIIADRNLDTDADGRLTGQLLHKVARFRTPARQRVPFFGPFTTVNGVIWPHLRVEARWYRFRVLNASNARIYRLFLLDEQDKPIVGAIQQIGTDHGLLPEPVSIDGELRLAAAERADILIDFAKFRGKRLRLVSTGVGASDEQPDDIQPGDTRPDLGLVQPDVMEFRVGSRRVDDRFRLSTNLSPSFVRIRHDTLPQDHEHRWIVLAPAGGPMGHPEQWEMEEVTNLSEVTIPSDGIIQLQRPDSSVITLRRVARTYEEAVTFTVKHNRWESWNFLNLAESPLPGPPHPMHIHLIGFQALRRDVFDSTFSWSVDGIDGHGGTVSPVRTSPGVLYPNEQGWKDTILVGRGELVTVAGQFKGGTGRFVYHCHMLEHEDEGMMRPFTVTPEEVLTVAPQHGAGHDGDHDH